MDILQSIPDQGIPKVLLGFDTWDDAGAILIRRGLALVKNVDIIAPVTNDPFEFGQIAAANSLSDIYAKGGDPIAAMDILCLPRSLSKDVAQQILKGALHKLSEAEVALLGGHTVEASEPKFGLSIVGLIKPNRIIRNSTCKPGDMLILTKPIGTGIIVTANKTGRLPSREQLSEAVSLMAELNKRAADAMLAIGVNACTDISGFGLLGHLGEMVKASNVGIRLFYDAIPLLSGVEALAAQKIFSPAVNRNREYLEKRLNIVQFDNAILGQPQKITVLYDPQTSGGLLISAHPKKANALLKVLRRHGVHRAAIIGEVTADRICRIEVLESKP
jgi:selenide,water dikinase